MESTSKILLIDDDQALLKTYQKLFTLKGFDIITCNNAAEALECRRWTVCSFYGKLRSSTVLWKSSC